MITMRAILVDDELLALQFLEKQLIKLNDIRVIGKFTFLDVNKEEKLINETDIVFLDIEMPETNGLELADLLLQMKPDLIIIFVTAFNEYAVEAFDLNALDYILKPVDTERLSRTLKRIEKSKPDKPTQIDSDNQILNVKLCNDLSFQIEDQDFKHIKWRTTRAKDLFLYLLHNEGQANHKAALVDLFWSDLPEDSGYSQLYTAIYHIRKTIKIFNDHFSLRSLHESYILEAKDVVIDVIEWENNLTNLNELTNTTINQWEETMKLYSEHFLKDYDMFWIQTERSRLEKIWIKTAFQIADYYKDTNQIENAEKWYLRIIHFKPEEEKAHLQLMKLYETLGLGLLIDHQFNMLEKISKDLEFEINSYVKKWYVNWKKY